MNREEDRMENWWWFIKVEGADSLDDLVDKAATYFENRWAQPPQRMQVNRKWIEEDVVIDGIPVVPGPVPGDDLVLVQ